MVSTYGDRGARVRPGTMGRPEQVREARRGVTGGYRRPRRRQSVSSTTQPVRGRSTRQRAAVAAALEEVEEFRSAQDLHDLLKHRGDSVGLTTVYRTLQSLADAGEIDV